MVTPRRTESIVAAVRRPGSPTRAIHPGLRSIRLDFTLGLARRAPCWGFGPADAA